MGEGGKTIPCTASTGRERRSPVLEIRRAGTGSHNSSTGRSRCRLSSPGFAGGRHGELTTSLPLPYRLASLFPCFGSGCERLERRLETPDGLDAVARLRRRRRGRQGFGRPLTNAWMDSHVGGPPRTGDGGSRRPGGVGGGKRVRCPHEDTATQAALGRRTVALLLERALGREILLRLALEFEREADSSRDLHRVARVVFELPDAGRGS